MRHIKYNNNIFVQVECGSQFSVCLTRSGSVFTWGKGDYHRLGHGADDHVRRPRKVAALQGRVSKNELFYVPPGFPKIIFLCSGRVSEN
jgi:alpha-tubulin suppressor-like RCC1 family protein